MAVVKPTPEEDVKIQGRMIRKYPQMYAPGWGVASAIKKARTNTPPPQPAPTPVKPMVRSEAKTGSTQFKTQVGSLSPDDYAAVKKMLGPRK